LHYATAKLHDFTPYNSSALFLGVSVKVSSLGCLLHMLLASKGKYRFLFCYVCVSVASRMCCYSNSCYATTQQHNSSNPKQHVTSLVTPYFYLSNEFQKVPLIRGNWRKNIRKIDRL